MYIVLKEEIMNKLGFIQKSVMYAVVIVLGALAIGMFWFRSNRKITTGLMPLSEDVFACPVRPVEDGSQALATIDGMPIITVKSLDADYTMLLEKNPQAKMLAQFMPNLKEQFFEGVLASKIVDKCVTEKGMNKCPEYQADLADLIGSVVQQLNKKYFSEQVPVTVSTAEAKAFYEEQKDKAPEILLSQGGVNVEGVEFDDANSAQAFMSQVLGKSDQFKDVVTKNDFLKQYRDFKMVNENSIGIDQELRDAILNIASLPSITIITVGDKSWVVNAKSREEKKHRPFVELKDMIEDALQRQKQDEAERGLIEKLKKEYNVDESAAKEYFKQADNDTLAQLSFEDEDVHQVVADSVEASGATRTV